MGVISLLEAETREITERDRIIKEEEIMGKEKAEQKKLKHSRRMSKQNHPNWKGGISSEIDKIRHRYNKELKIWRTEVFKRDNFTCRKCSKKGGDLEAHHIIPLSSSINGIIEVSNGLTLHKLPCHKIITKEDISLFQKINQLSNDSEKQEIYKEIKEIRMLNLEFDITLIDKKDSIDKVMDKLLTNRFIRDDLIKIGMGSR